ncbi:MAG: hypothetical protein ACE15C_02030 [Phycisphaerae bacterium]
MLQTAAGTVTFILASGLAFAASNSSSPSGEPVLEPPTLHCLGVYWIIKGDDNKNARVDLEYRRTGPSAATRPADAAWRKGPPLFRVEKLSEQLARKEGRHDGPLKVPDDSWLFAGSALMLAPDTEYELKLALTDPDGVTPATAATKTLKCRTIAEPAYPKTAPQYHVVPGSGGGRGTANDPYRGLAAAHSAARPGDVFWIHKGTYNGGFAVSKSGQPGKPIIWIGAGDGEAVLDGGGRGPCIDAHGTSHVWFEKLSIRNADTGIAAHEGANIVIRRCDIKVSTFGIVFNGNRTGNVANFFVSDNVIEGPCAWPRTKGIETPRGLQCAGKGHVVCYNRVRGFSDAIDTYQDSQCVAIDFHNNDVSELTDDGFEMDYSDRNTRCFNNRLTNVFQGISVQPVYGGPVYIFRNVMYNVGLEAFKMHSAPSGAIMVHNTVVKFGDPLVLLTPTPVHNCVYRNNLFVGGAGAKIAYECDPPMVDCDFDYDGFGVGNVRSFLKWNMKNYAALAEVRAKSPVEKHAVQVDPGSVFASGLKAPAGPDKQFDNKTVDLRLKPGTAAIDAGEALPGFNDGFAGKAPDLGAYELGAELPQYGPRPERKDK